jgi:hypothetical protein
MVAMDRIKKFLMARSEKQAVKIHTEEMLREMRIVKNDVMAEVGAVVS